MEENADFTIISTVKTGSQEVFNKYLIDFYVNMYEQNLSQI